jgi:TonB-dependent outer membrane receptor, SusC/RagA subfamily, signature region
MKKAVIILGLCILSLMQVSYTFAQEQKFTVSGTVYDQSGIPLIGADVIEKGTTNGVMTDNDGKFELKVANKEAIITINYIGFSSVELPATADFSKIILKEDSQLLDEVVVIGYGTVKKDDMTGSVTAIKAEELNRAAVTSPQQMMQGKIAGVQIIPGDGGPGSGATIRVRGAASLNASNDPLFVIDGVPIASGAGSGMANPLSTINPNDIETFTVLKDASATAIYGSRASNGVIIITTKKEKATNCK